MGKIRMVGYLQLFTYMGTLVLMLVKTVGIFKGIRDQVRYM